MPASGKRYTRKGTSQPRKPGSRTRRHSRKFLRRVPSWVVYVLIGLAVGGYAFFVANLINLRSTHPASAAYGDPIYPDNYEICGIDISHYQKRVDFDRLRNARVMNRPLRFVFIKATEGASIVDERFDENFRKARQANIIRGAYHFFIPDVDVEKQARFFIRHVKLQPGDLPPVLDIERTGRLSDSQLRSAVLTWLQIVERHYGVRPIIYAGYNFHQQFLDTDFKLLADYPFWIAHYYVKQLEYEDHWDFWQYTDKGQVDGIDGPVDCNVFNGNLEQMMRLTVK